jgi:glycosyltransferase involved in cell wall biosynthesis
MSRVSVIIPAYNEAGAVGRTVQSVRDTFAKSSHQCEIIVVDDGSTDDTGAEAEGAGAVVVRHPMNIGYGNAILTGASNAQFELIALTDADGTYPVQELPSMVDELDERGLDMLVGARQGRHYRGRPTKRAARMFFKFLAEFTTGTRIPDINSGLRVFRRSLIDNYRPVLCGGFSFTTTITVIAMLTQHFVGYRPIGYSKRFGKSKVRYFRDTLRAAQILTMTILIFNPIKLYILLAGLALGTLFPLGVVAAAVPWLSIPMLTICLALSVSYLVIGMGFLAEQHRASPKGVFSYQKIERSLRVVAEDSMQPDLQKRA